MGGEASKISPEEQQQKERKDGKFPTVESWNDAETKLVVSQPDGWACKVHASFSVGVLSTTDRVERQVMSSLRSVRIWHCIDLDGCVAPSFLDHNVNNNDASSLRGHCPG